MLRDQARRIPTALAFILSLTLVIGCASRTETNDQVADETAAGTAYDDQAGYDDPAMDDTAVDTTAEPVAARTYDWEWTPYTDLDQDRDTNLTETEFQGGFNSAYDTWDTDRDDNLTWSEFETAAYGWWDANNDDRLDENEWNVVSRDWTFDGYEWNTWGEVDRDGDGYLGTTEFQEFFNEEAWNTTWDRDGDGVVGRDEMADTFWDLFDGNDDNMIDENEYGTWAS